MTTSQMKDLLRNKRKHKCLGKSILVNKGPIDCSRDKKQGWGRITEALIEPGFIYAPYIPSVCFCKVKIFSNGITTTTLLDEG